MGRLASGWTADRDLPPIAKKTFTEIWKDKYADKVQTAPPPDLEKEQNDQRVELEEAPVSQVKKELPNE